MLSLCVLAAVLVNIAICLSGCSRIKGNAGEYTFSAYTSSLGTNWNPHTWQTNQDNEVLGYLITPLVSMQPKDTEEGSYQWVFEAARSVTDVTEQHRDDLIKYKVELPYGQSYDSVNEGYVYEIRLNDELRWEDGTRISAESYINSMKYLISPKMKNYRANLYISGESALAGAREYYESYKPIYKSLEDED